MNRSKIIIWTIMAVAGLALVIAVARRMERVRLRSMTIHGAVIRRDEDSRKELPISDAEVTATDGVTSVHTQSDASGYFKLTYPSILWPGKAVDLSFRHPDYMPLDLKLQSGLRLTTRELYVAAMSPLVPDAEGANAPPEVVSNIRIRYTVNSESETNIGSAVKAFQVVNKGNVACNKRPPCSPDGNWKAARDSLSLDAGSGNNFRSVRASCIAGPCPFTRIDSSGFADGGREIKVSALDWSDTATFLVEAEVFHAENRSNLRELYPVAFGRALNFTVPPTQEGVSIEADISGAPMVFPLGPELYLSWATCTARSSADGEKTTVYRCELKPGYRF